MDIIHILQEATISSLSSILSIAKIVIPLMLVLEFLREYKILDKLSNFLNPYIKFLGLSKNSSFPLLVGLIFGISYGAGVIVQSAKEGDISKQDLFLLSIFLIACHALIEDTLLFVAIGANGIILITVRFFTAILITYLFSSKFKNSFKNIEQKIN
ncbi:nucleoside recognition domain-containing protein [Peptostreptococcaceae bacterium AGR-M142]